MSTVRKVNPLRSRKMRGDSSISSALRTIARDYGLPAEAVMLVLPSGRRARRTASVSALRRAWNKQANDSYAADKL